MALAQGYSPDEAPRRMTVPPGFLVELVASEPLVRQPVAIDFDDAGRLWRVDPDSTPERLVLNRTVGLRDSWAKIEKASA